MKILIAINQSRVLYDFKRELVDALAARGAEVILTLEEDFRAEYFKKKNYRILPAPIDPRGMNPLSDAKLSRFYRELLTKERPDAALTFTIKPNVYCGRLCAKLGIPYYATISGLGSALNGALPLRALASFLYRRGLRGAERVFCQNAAIATWAESRGVATKERIEEIPGSGVDLTRFRALPYPEEEEGATILFIGRLMRDKGIREYVECARRVKETRPTTRFLIVGAQETGCPEHALAEEAAKEGIVEYCGYQMDVTPYIEKASAVMLPSYHEGLSNVLLEGAACARPLLASNVPGCAEIFDEGITGFGFEARSADSAYEALQRFLALDRETRAQMGLRGREKIAASFSREDVVRRYLRAVFGEKEV